MSSFTQAFKFVSLIINQLFLSLSIQASYYLCQEGNEWF